MIASHNELVSALDNVTVDAYTKAEVNGLLANKADKPLYFNVGTDYSDVKYQVIIDAYNRGTAIYVIDTAKQSLFHLSNDPVAAGFASFVTKGL